ncbi:MAG: hypothetical protein JST84_23665 [Acidobacteria bacterium]|nr:hypothetical protein [Acidobacteriota bacterium]
MGLDQINVCVPKSLIGRGEVNLELSVAGRKAKTAKVHFR